MAAWTNTVRLTAVDIDFVSPETEHITTSNGLLQTRVKLVGPCDATNHFSGPILLETANRAGGSVTDSADLPETFPMPYATNLYQQISWPGIYDRRAHWLNTWSAESEKFACVGVELAPPAVGVKEPYFCGMIDHPFSELATPYPVDLLATLTPAPSVLSSNGFDTGTVYFAYSGVYPENDWNTFASMVPTNSCVATNWTSVRTLRDELDTSMRASWVVNDAGIRRTNSSVQSLMRRDNAGGGASFWSGYDAEFGVPWSAGGVKLEAESPQGSDLGTNLYPLARDCIDLAFIRFLAKRHDGAWMIEPCDLEFTVDQPLAGKFATSTHEVNAANFVLSNSVSGLFTVTVTHSGTESVSATFNVITNASLSISPSGNVYRAFGAISEDVSATFIGLSGVTWYTNGHFATSVPTCVVEFPTNNNGDGVVVNVSAEPQDSGAQCLAKACNIVLIKPDLDMNLRGLDEDTEVTTGGHVWLNFDDDNGNGVSDTNDVSNGKENDLGCISLKLTPLGWITNGTACLSASIGATNYVRIWKDPLKIEAVTLPAQWAMPNFPACVYVEGIATSPTPRNVTLTFQYIGTGTTQNINVQDDLALTVIAPPLQQVIDTVKRDVPVSEWSPLGVCVQVNASDNNNDGKSDGIHDEAVNFLSGATETDDTNNMVRLVLHQTGSLGAFPGYSCRLSIASRGGGARIHSGTNVSASSIALLTCVANENPPSTLDITADVASNSPSYLVEGVIEGAVEVSLVVQHEGVEVLRQIVDFSVMPWFPDAETDGICDLQMPLVSSSTIEPYTGICHTDIPLGRSAATQQPSIGAAIRTWHADASDRRYFHRQMFNLDTRVTNDVTIAGQHLVRILRPSGRVVGFNLSNNGAPVAPDQDQHYRLQEDGDRYVLWFADGVRHYFNKSTGKLVGVANRYGVRLDVSDSGMTIDYGGSTGRIASVKSPIGTSTLSYDDTLLLPATTGRLTQVQTTTRDTKTVLSYISTNSCQMLTVSNSVGSSVVQCAELFVGRIAWLSSPDPFGTCLTQERGRISNGQASDGISFTTSIDGEIKAQTTYAIRNYAWGTRLDDPSRYERADMGLPTDVSYDDSKVWPGLVQGPDGSWTRYYYDAYGRVINQVSGFATNPCPADVDAAVDMAANEAFTYEYDATCSQDPRPRTITHTLLGVVVGKQFFGYNDGSSYTEQSAVSQAATANSSDNLKVTTEWVPSGIGKGYPSKVTGPGTVERVYTHITVNGSQLQTTVNVTGDPLGEATCTRIDSNGNICAEGVLAGSTLVRETVRTFDNQGRPLTEVIDPLHSNVWGYAGAFLQASSFTDIHKVTTTSTYNWLGHLLCANSLGIQYAYTNFDAYGTPWETIETAGSESRTNVWTYDWLGRPLLQLNPRNYGVTNTYRTSHAGTCVKTQTIGPTNVFRLEKYNPDGRLAMVFGPAVDPVTYSYEVASSGDGVFHVVETTYTNVPRTAYENFDSVWTSYTNGARHTKTVMDVAGRVREVWQSGTKIRSTTYNALNQVVSSASGAGRTQLFEYDRAGRPTFESLDRNGNGVRDAADRVTEYRREYASRDNGRALQTSIHATIDGTSTELACSTISGDGLCGWQKDPESGKETAWTKSAGSEIDSTVYADGTSNRVRYVNGQLASTLSRSGVGVTYSPDAWQRPASNTHPRSGNWITRQYYSTDTLKSLIDSGGRTNTIDRGPREEPSTVNLPGGSTIKQQWYDTGASRTINGFGQTATRFTMDSASRLTALQTYRTGAETMPEQIGDKTSFDRTELDWVQQKAYADDNVEKYLADPDGVVTQRTLARGTVISTTVDVAGDVTARSYSDATPVISLTRDELGRPLTVTDGIGTNTFAWNRRSQVTQETGPQATSTYAYAETHALRTNMSVTVGGATMNVAYTFTNARIASVAWGRPGETPATFTYTYHSDSDLMAALASDTGVVLRHEYDAAIDRRTAIIACTEAGASLAFMNFLNYSEMDQLKEVLFSSGEHLAYSYDTSNGAVAAHAIIAAPNVTTGTAPGFVSGVLGSNPVSTLFAMTYSTAGSAAAVTVNQACDGAANRTSDGTKFFEANSVNLSKPVGGNALYDADGNLTNDGLRTLAWDAEDRLTAVTPNALTNGARKTAYRYDHQQRLRTRIVQRWTNSVWTADYTDTFTYDGWQPVCQVRQGTGGSVTNWYLWGLDLAGQRSGQPGQAAGGIGGLVSIRVEGQGTPRVYLPVADQVGNIRSVINAATLAVVAWISYAPYGEVQQPWYADAQTRADLECASMRFQSKFQEQETGFSYYGYRWYNPATAKWLNRDPLGENGGVNLTAFCGNDPVNNVDPLGLAATSGGGNAPSISLPGKYSPIEYYPSGGWLTANIPDSESVKYGNVHQKVAAKVTGVGIGVMSGGTMPVVAGVSAVLGIGIEAISQAISGKHDAGRLGTAGFMGWSLGPILSRIYNTGAGGRLALSGAAAYATGTAAGNTAGLIDQGASGREIAAGVFDTTVAATFTYIGARGALPRVGPTVRIVEFARTKDPAIIEKLVQAEYGHVGISFGKNASGARIYGYGPTGPNVNKGTLLARYVFEGRLTDDTMIFADASELGLNVKTTSFNVTWVNYLNARLLVSKDLFLGSSAGKKYMFPPKRGTGMLWPANTYNCATYPRSVGLPTTHPTGYLSE